MTPRHFTLTAAALALMTLSSAAQEPGKAREPQKAQAPDKALVARGDSVFHGKLGGAICASCHGQDAKGVAGLGPNLTDAVWLHGDGSRKFVETLVRTGVPKPKKSTAVMPPFGGVPLDSAKVTALAAYVYSLGHR